MSPHDRWPLAALVVLAAACGSKKESTDSGKPPAPPPLVEPAAAPITQLDVKAVRADLSKPDLRAAYWKDVPRGEITLMAQPMITPRPASTQTDKVSIAAVHDDKYLSVRLHWKDAEKSEAGPLGTYSDAFAIEFPIKDVGTTPPMMGGPDLPVHIFHWRAQYQRDAEKGKPAMNDLYPNMNVDMYPLDFKEAPSGTTDQKEQFSPGVAVGNPQAYAKSGLDEIIAEGFSTSAVQDGHSSAATAEWHDGTWTLVITRPLAIDGGSTLAIGTDSGIAFAAWQGGKGEVGSRKSVTMYWLPLHLL